MPMLPAERPSSVFWSLASKGAWNGTGQVEAHRVKEALYLIDGLIDRFLVSLSSHRWLGRRQAEVELGRQRVLQRGEKRSGEEQSADEARREDLDRARHVRVHSSLVRQQQEKKKKKKKKRKESKVEQSQSPDSAPPLTIIILMLFSTPKLASEMGRTTSDGTKKSGSHRPRKPTAGEKNDIS